MEQEILRLKWAKVVWSFEWIPWLYSFPHDPSKCAHEGNSPFGDCSLPHHHERFGLPSRSNLGGATKKPIKGGKRIISDSFCMKVFFGVKMLKMWKRPKSVPKTSQKPSPKRPTEISIFLMNLDRFLDLFSTKLRRQFSGERPFAHKLIKIEVKESRKSKTGILRDWVFVFSWLCQPKTSFPRHYV